jgi:hypothetical protein
MGELRKAVLIYRIGMGDAINVAGAAVRLSKKYSQLSFPCRSNFKASCASIFSLHPRIHVFVLKYVDEYEMFPVIPEENSGDILSTNAELYGKEINPSVSRWENEYECLGVPYSERWDSCPIQEASKLVPQIEIPNEPYAFVHDDHSRGINIQERHISKGLRVVRPDPATPNILAYVSIITHATEGHYSDSSFKHLAESIETNGKLVYHEYARLGEPQALSRKTWVTIS